MKIIYREHIFDIVRSSLSYVDPYLLNQGDREAYIVNSMLRLDKSFSIKEKQNIFLLALFNNIGAYERCAFNGSADEPDRWSLIARSYIFLKYFSPLYNLVDGILYSPLNYCELAASTGINPEIPAMLRLAGEVEKMLRLGNVDYKKLESMAGVEISPRALSLFLRAEREFSVSGNIKSGRYKEIVSELLDNLVLSEIETRQYLEMIVYFMRFYSETTFKHIIMTVYLSMGIAGKLNVSVKEMEKIFYGTLLHDLGKVAIPVSILEKKGPLNEQEMRIMRSHVEITENILRGRIHPDVYYLAVCHHEKPNGSGYPFGLNGDDLTLCQRIIVVADMMSALQGERSYKVRYDKSTVLSILKASAEKGEICAKVFAVVEEHYDDITLTAYEYCNELLMQYEELYSKIDKLYNRMMLKQKV